MTNPSTKEKVLSLLEKEKGSSISGARIAEMLDLSRNAIWKAVKILREEGYPIEATTNKGYILSEQSDILSPESIYSTLGKIGNPFAINPSSIIIYDKIDSTINEAKRLLMDNDKKNNSLFNTIIIAKEQTAGRGRRGRSFASPKGDSIYISFIMHPQNTIEQNQMITISSAVAVCNTISEMTNESPSIKWVNDVIVSDKKICGILTEAVTDLESGGIEAIIIGIGININTTKKSFPKEIRDIAGSIRLKSGKRNSFVASLINNVIGCYFKASTPEIISEYREHSFLVGRPIYVLINESATDEQKKVPASVLSITDTGGLEVEYENGSKEILRAGEVSIRPADC